MAGADGVVDLQAHSFEECVEHAGVRYPHAVPGGPQVGVPATQRA